MGNRVVIMAWLGFKSSVGLAVDCEFNEITAPKKIVWIMLVKLSRLVAWPVKVFRLSIVRSYSFDR
jgi:hypothetical protein